MGRFVAGLFGGTQKSPPAAALRVNTALQGVPIPLLLGGQNRVAGNLIDYYGFNSKNVSGGGKGGFVASLFKGQSQTQYYVTFLLALCEGPATCVGGWITGSPGTWVGGFPSGELELFVQGQNGQALAFYESFAGDYAQTVWGYTESYWAAYNATNGTDKTTAQAYRGIAYIGFENFSLGGSPQLPQINVEIFNPSNTGFLSGQPDGDPSVAFTNFLTNQYYGILGFPASRLGSLALWRSYCLALGLAVSPVIASTVSAQSFANDLTKATNSASCWQDGALTVVPYGDAAITAGSISAITETHEVPTTVNGSGLGYPQITVGNVGTFVSDGGVTYASGTALTAVTEYAPTGVAGTGSPGQGQYYQSEGVYYFNFADAGQTVNITYDYAAAASYNPDLTPLYAFTVDDCLPNQASIGTGFGAGKSPFLVVRKTLDQMINDLKVEYLDRNNSYNPVDIEQKDEALITAFGKLRPSDIKQLHFFCLASAAQQSMALQLVRGQIARTFQWTVGRHFMMIVELMALVTVTDPGQGLNEQPVRIIEIQENSDYSLTLTAEDFPGTVNAPAYGLQPSQGATPNYNAAAPAVNPPIIFEPGAALLGNNPPQLWVAASGSGGSGAEYGLSNWGGCAVWLSLDNENYSYVDSIYAPARMGVSTAILNNFLGSNPDTADTLAVNLSESGGALASGTALDAQLGVTLCVIDEELIAYETATLTSANNYNLTTLYRGLYGTEITAHAPGAPFARLDDSILQLDLPAQFIGQTLYIKLASFNQFGGGAQALSACTVYEYVPYGAAYTPGAAASGNAIGAILLAWSGFDMGSVAATATVTSDNGAVVSGSAAGSSTALNATSTPAYVPLIVDLNAWNTPASLALNFVSPYDNSGSPLYRTQWLTQTAAAVKSGVNTQTFTVAFWLKYASGGTLFSVGSNSSNYFQIVNIGSNQWYIEATVAGTSVFVLELPNFFSTAWNHFCFAIDTTQSTAAKRVKMSINGVLQSLDGGMPPQNQALPMANVAVLGNSYSPTAGAGGNCIAAEFAEFYYIDGQALPASAFYLGGVPIKFQGSYTGVADSYLKFADPTTVATLCGDFSGENNNWTPSATVTLDCQSSDYP